MSTTSVWYLSCINIFHEMESLTTMHVSSKWRFFKSDIDFDQVDFINVCAKSRPFHADKSMAKNYAAKTASFTTAFVNIKIGFVNYGVEQKQFNPSSTRY